METFIGDCDMHFQCFEDLILSAEQEMKLAPLVKPTHWQGRDISDKPDMETYEILNYHASCDLQAEFLSFYRKAITPDLPWADDHFDERVCGYPLNPGTEWANWRLGKGADGFRDLNGQFNINYMERIWPKYAGKVPYAEVPQELPLNKEPLKGIRYEYGDFNDVVQLLLREPLTRQAYLPIFFPEDTGAVHRDRTPCSLGWQFIRRDDKLHVVYFLRSCDLVNHFRNDLYFTVRKLLWVLDELRELDPEWCQVSPGTLTTHITSFHCFRGDFHKL